MACASEQDIFQQWLAQINPGLWALCGTSVRGAFLGELETSYTQSLKLSTVTAAGVNLFRTRQEIKTATTPGSTPCFSWKAAPESNRTTSARC